MPALLVHKRLGRLSGQTSPTWLILAQKYVKGKPCKPYNSTLGEFFRVCTFSKSMGCLLTCAVQLENRRHPSHPQDAHLGTLERCQQHQRQRQDGDGILPHRADITPPPCFSLLRRLPGERHQCPRLRSTQRQVHWHQRACRGWSSQPGNLHHPEEPR